MPGKQDPGFASCITPCPCCPALGLEAGGRGQLDTEDGSQTCICVCLTCWPQGSSVQCGLGFGGEARPKQTGAWGHVSSAVLGVCPMVCPAAERGKPGMRRKTGRSSWGPRVLWDKVGACAGTPAEKPVGPLKSAQTDRCGHRTGFGVRTAEGGDRGAAKAYSWRGAWSCRQHPRSWARAPGLPSCSRANAVSHTQQPLHQACEGPQNPPEHGPPARRGEELAAQVLSQRT